MSTLQATVADWLARAQQAPEQARREWEETGVALLPLGHRFEAVRIPADLVRTAVCKTTPQEITERLSTMLNGPVVYDGRTLGGTYYPLMRPRRKGVWKHQHVAPWLGSGTYLGVPRLGRTQPPGTYWVVPPRFEGDLCEPYPVAALISYGVSDEQVTR